MNDMNTRNDIKAGSVITIDGVKDCPKFVVLDVYADGSKLCITKTPVLACEFGENSNYADEECTLRIECEKWLAGMAGRGLDLAHVKEREISLLSTGGVDYGTLKVQAAPLTFDEWRKYARLCMRDNANKRWWYWLAASAAYLYGDTRSPYTSNTGDAWHVGSDGSYYDYDVTVTRGLRPALILDSKLPISDGSTVE